MENGKLDKDRIAAADALLKHTTPKDFKIELDMGFKQDSATQNLMEQLASISAKQKELLTNGVIDLGKLGAMKVLNDVVVEGEFTE
jgi:D-serine deaminase-like pyridoxal phosphate-dependent protein